ncbi:NLRC3 [Symbiodinium natans]|uniref:NLRC3 protein n=1 Tax=Symbiodinium natans TaxID=878477 RepID=A0A812GLZ4_9DINO|nr:NLRC3 [Symbiodinium natans]
MPMPHQADAIVFGHQPTMAPVQSEVAQELPPEVDLNDRHSLVGFLLDPGNDIRLITGLYLQQLHREGRIWPRRQEVEEHGFVTERELHNFRERETLRSLDFCNENEQPRIIAVSHVWETREHPDPLGRQLQALVECRKWPARLSWYFIDYMSLHQFYRGDQDSPAQKSFSRVMNQMHVFYSHEDTYTYQLTRVTEAQAIRESAKEVPIFHWPHFPAPPLGKLAVVPCRMLTTNETPYSARGWCCAEALWSAMRSDGSHMVCIDDHVIDQHGKAPMAPEDFCQRVAEGNLRFTHRNDQEAVVELQKSVFHLKAQSMTSLTLELLPQSEVRILCNSLGYFRELKTLTLHRSHIIPGFFKALADAVPQLHVLHASSNDLSHADGLDYAIGRLDSLKELNLSKNCLGDDAMQSLAKGIAPKCKLETLRLASNQVRNAGAEALAQALRKNTSIQLLDLSNNLIEDDGAAALAEAMQENRHIWKLILSSNRLTGAGVRAWAEVLPGCHLTSLELFRGHDIDKADKNILAKRMRVMILGRGWSPQLDLVRFPLPGHRFGAFGQDCYLLHYGAALHLAMVFFLAAATAITSERRGSTILLLVLVVSWVFWMLSTMWGLLGTLLIQKEPFHDRNLNIWLLQSNLALLAFFLVLGVWVASMNTLKEEGASVGMHWVLPSLGVVSFVFSLSLFRRNDLRRICCVLRARCLKARAEA